MPTPSQSEVRRLIAIRIALPVVAALSVIALSGCTPVGSASISSTSARVSGAIIEVGGPLGSSGSQPPSRPLSATAAVYHRNSGQRSISGAAVTTVHTSASSGGRFALSLTPGSYFVVAESAGGQLISAPRRITVDAGEHLAIKLTVSVP